MNTEQIGGIVRAVAAAIAGIFVGKGLISGETATWIAGGAATLAIAGWSIWTNKPGTTIAPK